MVSRSREKPLTRGKEMKVKRTKIKQIDCWKVSDRPSAILMPSDATKCFSDSFPADSRERFYMLPLDTRHKPMCDPVLISIGTLNSTLVSPREVFAPALVARAAAIVVAHNHPSGDTKPSRDDIQLTKFLVNSGYILGIDVLDHLIFPAGDIFGDGDCGDPLSLRDNCVWPKVSVDF